MKTSFGYSKRTKPGHELPFDRQAKSINMRLLHLKTLLDLHIKTAHDEKDPIKKARRDERMTREKCIRQLEQLMASLKV